MPDRLPEIRAELANSPPYSKYWWHVTWLLEIIDAVEPQIAKLEESARLAQANADHHYATAVRLAKENHDLKAGRPSA